MADDMKKPSLATVMADKGSSDDMTTEDDEGAEDSSAAAGEVFDMLVSKDREGFIQALKAFKAC